MALWFRLLKKSQSGSRAQLHDGRSVCLDSCSPPQVDFSCFAARNEPPHVGCQYVWLSNRNQENEPARLSYLIDSQTAAANWQVRLPRPLQLPERHVIPVQDTRAHMHMFGLGADGSRRSSRFRSLRCTYRGPVCGSVYDGVRVRVVRLAESRKE